MHDVQKKKAMEPVSLVQAEASEGPSEVVSGPKNAMQCMSAQAKNRKETEEPGGITPGFRQDEGEEQESAILIEAGGHPSVSNALPRVRNKARAPGRWKFERDEHAKLAKSRPALSQEGIRARERGSDEHAGESFEGAGDSRGNGNPPQVDAPRLPKKETPQEALSNEAVFPGKNQRAREIMQLGIDFPGAKLEATEPHGLIIGEAPGKYSDPCLPCWPSAPGDSGTRLMEFADISISQYVSRLRRTNLCHENWTSFEARLRVSMIVEWLMKAPNLGADGRPLRVLLLGHRVVTAWELEPPYWGRAGIGPLKVMWIPHPSGKNLIYNDQRNRERAKRVIRWAMGLT